MVKLCCIQRKHVFANLVLIGERRFSKYSLPVDGFSEQQNIVYEFLNSLFLSYNANGTLQVTHVLNCPVLDPLRRDIKNSTRSHLEGDREQKKKVRTKRFSCGRDKGVQMVESKEPEEFCFPEPLKSVTPNRKCFFQKILEGIRNETLYTFFK